MRRLLGNTLLGVERIFRRSTRFDPLTARQLLVLEYRLPLGCCVHLTPLYEALKQCRPELRIAVATRSLGADVLRYSPLIDDLIETADPLTDLATAVKDLRRSLRLMGLQPDCVLTGIADQRTRIALLGLLGASGWRGGFTQASSLYQRPLQPDATLSHIGNNLLLARLLGCEPRPTEPRVYFSPNDAAIATSLLVQANPAGRPVVALVTQTSGGQRTGWHTLRFVEVIRAVEAQGFAIVYLGTSADQPPIESIRRAAGNLGHSIAGRTTVRELAAVLAMCDAAISLDTGTMHVGRAVRLPMVVLGPSWQKPGEWMPLGIENVRILRGEDRDNVPPDYRLDEISSDNVIAAFQELIGRHPPSVEARASRVARSLSQVDHSAPTPA